MIKVITGDCLVEVPKLKGDRLVFADPPYNIGIDYGKGKKKNKLLRNLFLKWYR